MTPLRTLIVDDEAPARRRIRRLLAAEPDIAVIGDCGDGASAIAVIARDRPDLVLLDIQMPECDGFAVVQAIPAGQLPAVLFVTAHDRYALRAFDVHAVDYLLKPFSAERFRRGLQRARDLVAQRSVDPGLLRLAESLRSRPNYLSRVAVRAPGRTNFVELAAVEWIEAADNYVTLHVRGREHLVRETMAAFETQIDPDRFVRVHRSAIVAIDRVSELRTQSHGDATAVLDNGVMVPVSRTFRDRLHKVMGHR